MTRAEEAHDVRGHVHDPDLGLFAARGLGTDLHTLGAIEWVVECPITLPGLG